MPNLPEVEEGPKQPEIPVVEPVVITGDDIQKVRIIFKGFWSFLFFGYLVRTWFSGIIESRLLCLCIQVII